MKKIIFLILGLILHPTVQAANWYVSQSVAASGNGQSWATAWKNTSNIVWSSVSSGDTILLDGGTAGFDYAAFSITKGVLVQRSNESNHSGPVKVGCGLSVNASNVTLDGLDRDRFTFDCVSAATAINVTSSGNNFILRNATVLGYFNGADSHSIVLRAPVATISRSNFIKSTSQDFIDYENFSGGAGKLVIDHSLFKDNSLGTGGFHRDIMNVWQSGNFDLDIRNNIFMNNGDGFLLQNTSAINNIIFAYNVSYDMARPITFGTGSKGANSISIYNNTSYDITCIMGGNSKNNLIKYVNSPDSCDKDYTSIFLDSGAKLTGVKFLNPNSPLDPNGKPFTALGGLNIISGSSSIDMGVDVGLTEDILGNGIANGKPDLGAYEFNSAPVKKTVFCVGPSATGNGSGDDWNNLLAWSTVPARGNTYYLIDGTYPGKTFSTAVNGTALITIKKATPSEHGISTNWNDALGDGQAVFSGSVKFNTSYWIFDGVKGNFPSKNFSDYGFYFPSTAFVIILEGAHTFTHVRCSHISATSISADTPRYAFGTDGATLDTSTITFSSNLISGFQVAFFVSGPTGKHGGWLMEYNVILNALSTDNNHGSGLDCNYGMQNPIYRYNIMQGYSGGGCQTCAIEANNGDMTGAEVYGNVFEGLSNCNECIGGTSGGKFSNAKIYNNTFYRNTGGGAYMVPWVGAGSKGGSGIVAYNNLIVSQQGLVGGGTTNNYNAYFGASSIPLESNGQTKTGNPLKDPSVLDYTLTANTDAGTPLPAPYNIDPLGKTRTTWTRGAYEFGGSTPVSTPHPADSNTDYLMALNEATKYGACWKNPAAFGDCPAGIAIDYAVRAGTIWAGSATGQYQFNSLNACPLCWEVKP